MKSSIAATSSTSSLLNQQQQQQKLIIDEIVSILKKDVTLRTTNDSELLEEWSFLVPEAHAKLKAKLESKTVLKQRSIEQEESFESIVEKVNQLVKLIQQSHYIVLYTGAGISTSASIPDYRGPNGLWTQIRKTGTFSVTKIHDLSLAEPTYTHMAIKELCRRKIVNHVVSQNCDGLHLRSGIQSNQLSEIHGNMYIEVCPTCEKQYYRECDVTEKTCRFRHKTGRKCHKCPEPNNNLIDTIVLYGERSRSKMPMNWERASKAAKKAELIICMGSSLKTLRRYSCLWPKKHLQAGIEQQTKLAIINLQYTSKDKNAVLKINGKCDIVMQLVMQKLNINVPNYDWTLDPLMKLAIPFTPEERLELKRNLIFESRQLKKEQSSSQDELNNTSTNELSKSPSLFVSEITDDPEKKSLRMRIRAINTSGLINSSNDCDDANNSKEEEFSSDCLMTEFGDYVEEKGDIIFTEAKQESTQVQEKQHHEEKLLQQAQQSRINYVLPGWLGRSLGNSRTNGYRRKRHGNKGKRHSSVLKSKQNDIESSEENPVVPSQLIVSSINTITPVTDQKSILVKQEAIIE